MLLKSSEGGVGGGYQKPKFLKDDYEAKLKVPEGWGWGWVRPKTSHGRGR